MIRQLLCAIGLHKWDEWSEIDRQIPVPDNPLHYRQKYIRDCKCCTTRQVRICRLLLRKPYTYTIDRSSDD